MRVTGEEENWMWCNTYKIEERITNGIREQCQQDIGSKRENEN